MKTKKAVPFVLIMLLQLATISGCGVAPEVTVPSPTPTSTTMPTPTPMSEPFYLEDLALRDNELGGTVSAMLTGNPIMNLPDGTFIIYKTRRIDASGSILNTYSMPVAVVAGDSLIGMDRSSSKVTLYEFDFDGSNKQTVLDFELKSRDVSTGNLLSAAVYENYLFLLIDEGSISRNKTGDSRSIWQDLTALYRVSLADKTVVRVEQPEEAVDYRAIINDRIYMTVMTEPYEQNISSTDLNGEDLRIEYGLDELAVIEILEKSEFSFVADLPLPQTSEELREFLEMNGLSIYDLLSAKAYRKIDLIYAEEVDGETVLWFIGYIPNDFDIVRVNLSTVESAILASFKQSNITVTGSVYSQFGFGRPCYSEGYIYYVAPWDGVSAHRVYKTDSITGHTTLIQSFGSGEYAYKVFVSNGSMLIDTVKDSGGSVTVHQYFMPDGDALLEITQK